jgi:hypothetical protein
MMTSEARAYLLLLLAEQEQHEEPRVNLSIPFNDQKDWSSQSARQLGYGRYRIKTVDVRKGLGKYKVVYQAKMPLCMWNVVGCGSLMTPLGM